MRLGSLCTGIGGLDLAVEHHFGAELVWCAEIDPAASRVLAARWPDVPNLGDFRAVTPPAVDVLCGGFPCQPVSSAGKRAGTDDERWLFDDICELVGRMDAPPRVLVFENVAGLLTANDGDAMARVVHGLAALGYVGSWRSVRAADAGACHRRERVFIVATHADRGGLEERPELDREPVEDPADGRARGEHADRLDHAPADADGARAGRERGAVPGAARGARRAGEHVHAAVDARPDTPTDAMRAPRPGERRQRASEAVQGPGEVERSGRRHRVAWGDFAPAVHRWERTIGRPAPSPVDDRGRLSPRFVEWMMGFDDGWCTDVLERRTDALRCLGNAVVPQQAAYALRLAVTA